MACLTSMEPVEIGLLAESIGGCLKTNEKNCTP